MNRDQINLALVECILAKRIELQRKCTDVKAHKILEDILALCAAFVEEKRVQPRKDIDFDAA